MSDSDDAVIKWQIHIQKAIDRIEVGALFVFEYLFSEDEWAEFTDNLRLARSVTDAFKRRIKGLEGANNPIFSHVEWTDDVNRSGRTVNFRRVAGNHGEAP